MEITQNVLKYLFEYINGNLYWKIKIAPCINIGNQAGTLHHTGYCQIRIDGKTYRAHRLIFLYHYGYLPKYIDHIDNNSLNNNIENLRAATLFQNSWNSIPDKNTSSKYKGVSWNKKNKKWISHINFNKERFYLGSFTNEKDAVIAYNIKGMELFGEYAYLNEVR